MVPTVSERNVQSWMLNRSDMTIDCAQWHWSACWHRFYPICILDDAYVWNRILVSPICILVSFYCFESAILDYLVQCWCTVADGLHGVRVACAKWGPAFSLSGLFSLFYLFLVWLYRGIDPLQILISWPALTTHHSTLDNANPQQKKERERKRGREKERKKEREKERKREREKERKREKRKREREKEWKRDREKERLRERETERQR